MARRRIAATAAALALVLSGGAPADQKPTPAPSSGSTPKTGVPNVGIVAAVQKPDLVVSFVGSSPGLPTGFTVKNIGSADSKVCVLKVTAAFVPPATNPANGGSCLPFMTPQECANLQAFAAGILDFATSTSTNMSNDSIKKACGNPFADVIEAVPVLRPGESKTFMRDRGPYQVTLTGFITPTSSPQMTHLKQCPPTLVCAWDVTAVVDASNDNDERSKANNTSTRRALREVTFK